MVCHTNKPYRSFLNCSLSLRNSRQTFQHKIPRVFSLLNFHWFKKFSNVMLDEWRTDKHDCTVKELSTLMLHRSLLNLNIQKMFFITVLIKYLGHILPQKIYLIFAITCTNMWFILYRYTIKYAVSSFWEIWKTKSHIKHTTRCMHWR